VRAGQRAVGKSVFRGTKIESFHIEIVGVLHEFDGTRNLILGRVLDGPVVARKSGIIAGMSGSPVYIKGRLAGAIALAWSFSKEPIAGITPIEEMLEAWQPKPSPEPAAAGSGQRLAHPLRVGGKVIERVRVAPKPGQPDLPGVMTLTPVGGYIQASGFSQRAVEQLSELLAPYGLKVLQGPGGGMEHLRPPVVPGAAVGAQIVGGDFDITGLGTITLVEGNRVLAFGHPMFQLGEVDLPMTGGYVYDIMPSLLISNKIMSATQVVGRVSRDMQTAIAGEVGKRPDPLALTVEVTDRDLGKTRRFQLTVARIRELLPALTAFSVMNAVDETRGRVARGTARVVTEIEAEGRPPMRREEFGYSEGDAAMAVLPALLRPLAVLTDSPFGKLRLRRVRVRVETEDERRTATIERAAVPQSRFKAGDEVTVAVTLRPYGGDLVEVPVRFKLPADLPRGQVRLAISGGGEAEEARGAIGAPRPAPVSLSQLNERYLTQDRRQDLVVQAGVARTGASLLGEELPDFPLEAVEALRASHLTDLRPAASVLKVVTPTQWALSGRLMVSLVVESPLAPAGPPTPRRPQAQPQPPAGGPEEEEPGPEEQGGDWYDGGRPTMAGPGPDLLLGAGARPGRGKPEPQPPAKKEQEAKPLTRAPQAWVQQEGSDYAKARLTEVAVGEDGRVSLGPSRTDLAQLPADVIWGLAIRAGVAFAGTGSAGLVYKVSEKGEASPFFATGELHVHALAFDPEGNLYAATSPRGKLFRIAPDGKGELWYQADGKYLWCLTVGPDGTIYAGAGTPARIYAIGRDGKGKMLAELPTSNVLSLARTADGDLYAGTSDGGVVYRVRPDGTASAVCQLPGAEVAALALDAKGNLYASASPSGDIYLVPADGLPSLYCETDEKCIYGLALLPGGELAAATGPSGLLLRVGPNRRPETLFKPEAGVATALAVADGRIYLGSAGPAALRRFGPDYASSGTLESPVLDVERVAQWGRLELTAETPSGTALAAETRSGDAPIPEDHWSAWAPVRDGDVLSPPANHLQYRLLLSTNDPQLTPTVRQVRLGYQPSNRAPMVALKAPSPGEAVAKKYTIKWEGQDPDKDTLTYDVAISRDLGASWYDLKQGITETKYEWDTSPTSDGRCLLRVITSDRQSEPGDPEQDQATVVMWVDNTAPEMLLFRSSVAVQEDRRVRVKGVATDKLSAIRSVEYRVDSEDWRSLPLAAVDDLASDFTIITDPLSAGKHTIEARAFDAAGNVGTDKVEAEVKEPAKPAEKPGEKK
jgi:outer membrane protein assembly factor BamB